MAQGEIPACTCGEVIDGAELEVVLRTSIAGAQGRLRCSRSGVDEHVGN